MKNKTFLSIIILFAAIAANAGQSLTLRGYLKAMPGLRVDRDFSNTTLENTFHNRLNLRWSVSPGLNFHLEGRNKVFYNEMFADFPGIKPLFTESLENDNGLLDLSWVWMDEGAWVGHSNIDRLFLDFRLDKWQVRVGRQRINWGITMVSNPNDLFNTYSFFDPDYPERPGSDAIRVQYNRGFASRTDLAWRPASNVRESVGAMLWSANHRGYDLQAIAGYYYHRAALGLGWAGNIGGAGFKGEGTWFYHLDEDAGEKRANLVMSTGLDYMFANGTFAILEFLYNGGFKPVDNVLLLLNQPLRADNIMFSEYAATLSLQHSFSPVFNGSIALMALPDQRSFFLAPSVTRSVITNLDVNLMAQVLTGSSNSLFSEAGSAWYASVKYSF